MLVAEQRLTGTIEIGLAEVESLLELSLTHEIGSRKKQIGTIGTELTGIVLTILRSHLTLLVGLHVERVECLGNREKTLRELEELRRVLTLLHIQLLVNCLILHENRLVPNSINAFVLSVYRILEQPRHELLSLFHIAAAFQKRPCLAELFFLSQRQARSHHQ